ncbi:MAG: glycosyltransferase family 2 protein [bacterium]|nr:glycosyltransferase family 2 protein [bacterium]
MSFVIVARNSARYIPYLLSDLIAQDFPPSRMEVIFVDGASTDGTRQIAASTLATSGFAYSILDNPAKILSTGWNVALRNSRHEIIVRVDAHSRIPVDFVTNNVLAHARGELITGGPIISIAETHRSSILNAVEISRFGAGAANFRNASSVVFHADTVGFAAYRRDVFTTVGGYHEHLVRHQDNEIHFRMKRAGYRFCFDPAIHSTRFVRDGLASFLRQKYMTGYWIPLAATVQPRCFAIRHYTPMLFCCALAVTFAFAIIAGFWRPLFAVALPYCALSIVYALRSQRLRHISSHWHVAVLPVLFLGTHLSYGIGTIAGSLRAPGFWLRHRRYKTPAPLGNNGADPLAQGTGLTV